MPNINSFSKGLDGVLEALRPYNNQAGESSFPRHIDAGALRRGGDQSLRPWFQQICHNVCEDHPERIAMEENIAVLAKLRWRKKKQLFYANIQVVVCACDLATFILDPDQKAIYLRLDCDYETLGTPFSHPLPHIHAEGELSPRFALDGGLSENVVVDFFEFIYRQYAPDAWLRWSEKIWRDAFGPSSQRKDLFRTILDAFGDNQFQVLRSHSAQLARFKRALRKAKDEKIGFDLRLLDSDREVLEYPLAR
jgi:hypothetical protein